jgi:nucleoside-diphosphate kinase
VRRRKGRSDAFKALEFVLDSRQWRNQCRTRYVEVWRRAPTFFFHVYLAGFRLFLAHGQAYCKRIMSNAKLHNQAQFENERTLVLIKPDGVQRSLMGEIIRRIERTGLKFIAFKFLVPAKSQLIAHYNKDDAWFLSKGKRVVEDRMAHNLPVDKEPIEYGKEIIDLIVDFMTAGPILAFVVQGSEAVAVVKKLTGATEPKTSDVGTIRGDLTVDSYNHSSVQNRAVRNLLHCSESPEEAEREIAVWFKENELIKYKLISERMLYDVNLDGILE